MPLVGVQRLVLARTFFIGVLILATSSFGIFEFSGGLHTADREQGSLVNIGHCWSILLGIFDQFIFVVVVGGGGGDGLFFGGRGVLDWCNERKFNNFCTRQSPWIPRRMFGILPLLHHLLNWNLMMGTIPFVGFPWRWIYTKGMVPIVKHPLAPFIIIVNTFGNHRYVLLIVGVFM